MLYVAVAVNLGVLGVFKYLTFLVRTVNQLPGVAIAVPSIVLPVGISFFTFQGLSYVIDVYRNERLKSTRFRDVLLYIALFPQLVAGPIVRYEDVADEIKSRRHTLEQLANGLRRFIIGLSKKLMIADVCGSVVTLIYSAKSSALDSRTAWLAAVCYLIQIYLISADTVTWPLDLACVSGFTSRKTLIIHTSRPAFRNSGADGISLFPLGSGNTCISLWAETGRERQRHTATS